MTSLVFTCLLGLATPLAGQQTPPPAVPTMAPQPGQAQQGRGQQGQQPQGLQGQGRGARGGTPPAAPTPEAPTAKPSTAHYDAASLQNIRVEVTLTDTAATDGPSKKSVSMMVVDNNNGQIRSQGPGSIMLNVDAMPHLRPDGKIYLSVGLYYLPEAVTTAGRTTSAATLNEAVSVIVTDGKPMVISQSADPRGDRKVTVEVTATVVK
jgi:hypothetical protein